MRRRKQAARVGRRVDVRSAPLVAGEQEESAERRRVALELEEMMAGGPHRWQIRPLREPRRVAKAEGPLHLFEVAAVEPGRGAWVQCLSPLPSWPEELFVVDVEASYALAPGDLFACQAESPEDVWIWPFWESCPHCLQLIAERRGVQ